MKDLRKILFTTAMMFGMTFAVSAQKEKPPPKDPPPVINPQPKNPPKPEPTPKKPGGMAIWKNETGESA